jgi:hypothetical protein
MTTCTPLYNIPVVEGTDPPCDIGNTLCAIAQAAEVQLDALDSLEARTAATIPLLKVAMTIAQPTVSTASDSTIALNFDTVLVDTDNMFDSSFPDVITFNHPGIWLMTANLWSTTTGAGGVNDGQGVSIVLSQGTLALGWPGGVNPVSANVTIVSPNTMYINAAGVFPILAAGVTAFVQGNFTVSGTDGIHPFYADASFAWLGDLS